MEVRKAWQCNQCGSNELNTTISEDDVEKLNCGRCGGSEWHRVSIDENGKETHEM